MFLMLYLTTPLKVTVKGVLLGHLFCHFFTAIILRNVAHLGVSADISIPSGLSVRKENLMPSLNDPRRR